MYTCLCGYSTIDDVSSVNWKYMTDNDIINYNLNTKQDHSRIRLPLDALRCMSYPVTIIKQILIIFIMTLLTLYIDVFVNVFQSKSAMNRQW